jgi:hypothetical protein
MRISDEDVTWTAYNGVSLENLAREDFAWREGWD